MKLDCQIEIHVCLSHVFYARFSYVTGKGSRFVNIAIWNLSYLNHKYIKEKFIQKKESYYATYVFNPRKWIIVFHRKLFVCFNFFYFFWQVSTHVFSFDPCSYTFYLSNFNNKNREKSTQKFEVDVLNIWQFFLSLLKHIKNYSLSHELSMS